MSAKGRVCVIYNPAAGVEGQASVKDIVSEWNPAAVIFETREAGDGVILARNAARDFDVVAAAGGDGTVNEVMRGLIGTDAALGIIPIGSGNGMARHLGLPMDTAAALQRLVAGQRVALDVGSLNGHSFVCAAGIGFDAHVSRHFANAQKRGFGTYIRVVLERFIRYRSTHIRATIDGNPIEGPCYLLAFANGSQYGNDAMIAPHADCSDGILDACLIKRITLLSAIRAGRALFRGTLPTSGLALYHSARHARVVADREMEFHVDGEFKGSARNFSIDVMQGALNVMV